ncbi:hypothetical protein GPECTOR_3g452 [Gonium pectorale]|uniref:Protein kinase domain-containing protein n=1 Tax=Gonium pectorale TaxID=33097 RepID=A0A150GZN0_GONPE|nr:hypothetical protein GPECTOR_3g452 [Gonium pectorale]|eukprot:KXZ55319.1 hypothetical protein GPECTOR_3g452 [Gonium pectorale]
MRVMLKVYDLQRVPENAVHTIVREIRIHTELVHPNILALYGVFEEHERAVLVLESAARGDLFRIHRELPGCRMNERALVLVPLLEALAYLHSSGICHRDIKAPEVCRCPLKAGPHDNKDVPGLVYSTAADVWSVGILALLRDAALRPTPATEAKERVQPAPVVKAGALGRTSRRSSSRSCHRRRKATEAKERMQPNRRSACPLTLMTVCMTFMSFENEGSYSAAMSESTTTITTNWSSRSDTPT